ncbi:unnamed protein product [Soboliphyme baturini]|uniref:Zinc metalloproteinase n=1 Tax=Soboliphyme baturini TaxID=241478 RepID=A0A183ICX4_9BILA|nr:unnamed protein product [Soboliphyme baturini]
MRHKLAARKVSGKKLQKLKDAFNKLMSPAVLNEDRKMIEKKPRKILSEMNFNNPDNYLMGDVDIAESQYEDWLRIDQRPKRTIPDMFRNKGWKSRVIYYAIDSSLALKGRRIIQKTLRIWEQKTCLKFVENSQMDEGLLFVNERGCSSFIGHVGGVQTINLLFPECTHVGVISHLLSHALGAWHEQNRRDSSAFVTVHLDNITPDNYHAFLSFDDGTLDTEQLPYEYASIMHFDPMTPAMSLDSEAFTLTPIDETFMNVMGQRQSPSFLDYEKINAVYCADACSSQPTLQCLHNGYQNFSNCSECICPPGFGGTQCEGVEQTGARDCGGELQATASPQYFTTPSYPNKFPRKQYCVWYIKAEREDQRVFLKFVETFDLPCQPNCRWSYVEVKVGEPFNRVGARFCCKRSPTASAPLASADNEMVVIFRSDIEVADGFRARYCMLATEANTHSWSAWSECTQKCGGCGRMMRQRTCQRPCESMEVKKCNFNRCINSKFIINNGEFFILINGCCVGLAPGSDDTCQETNALKSLMGGLLGSNKR